MFISIIDGIKNGKIACNRSIENTRKKVNSVRNNYIELMKLEKTITRLLKATNEIEIKLNSINKSIKETKKNININNNQYFRLLQKYKLKSIDLALLICNEKEIQAKLRWNIKCATIAFNKSITLFEGRHDRISKIKRYSDSAKEEARSMFELVTNELIKFNAEFNYYIS